MTLGALLYRRDLELRAGWPLRLIMRRLTMGRDSFCSPFQSSLTAMSSSYSIMGVDLFKSFLTVIAYFWLCLHVLLTTLISMSLRSCYRSKLLRLIAAPTSSSATIFKSASNCFSTSRLERWEKALFHQSMMRFTTFWTMRSLSRSFLSMDRGLLEGEDFLPLSLSNK